MPSDARPAAPRLRPGLVAAAAPALLVAGTSTVLVVLEGIAGFAGFVGQFHLFGVIVSLGFCALAVIVLRQHPGHAVGALAAGIAWAFALSVTLEHHGYLGLDRGWPGATWLVWAGTWIWFPGLWAVPTLLLLRFPDGRLPGPRWRVAEIWSVVALLLLAAGMALTPYGEADLAPLVDTANPVASPLGPRLLGVALPAGLLAVAAALAATVVRFRPARGAERAQLTWALAGLITTVVVVGTSVVLVPYAALAPTLAAGLLPATFGVAILRHRLWDLDVVLTRSLAYGLTTTTILLLYLVTVGALGGLLGRTTGAPVVATAVAALVVLPLRERAQRLAARLRYGDRGDPYTALARLGAQLDAAGSPDRLLGDVTDAVVRALRLRGAAITVDDRALTSVGKRDGHVRLIPLVFRGEAVGELHVHLAAGEELAPTDERLLADLSRHVAAALHADRLRRYLLASQLRLVTAREEERRRIRHDLHDDLGPTLAGVALEVERASLEAREDPEAVVERLTGATVRIRRAVTDLRALVEGLRPASLDELGLTRAVQGLLGQLQAPGLDLCLETDGDLDGLPAAVEVAAYRIVGEALTNVVRHASASRCRVCLSRVPDALHLLVEDDGRGGARTATTMGVGLRSMRERATELGGRIDLTSQPGAGTRVEVTLPVGAP